MIFDWGQREKIESKVLVPPVNISSDREDLILELFENVNWVLFSCIFPPNSDFPGKLEREKQKSKQGTEKLVSFRSKMGVLYEN